MTDIEIEPEETPDPYPRWTRHLKSQAASTQSRYRARIIHLTAYMEERNLPWVEDSIEQYFEDLHDRSYATSTCWSMCTPIKDYFLYALGITICDKGSMIPKLFSQWQKEEEVKQSKVFSKVDLALFCNEAPDSKYLNHKVAAVLGTHGALRRSEILSLDWAKMEFEEHHHLGKVMRKKRKGNMREDYFLITGVDSMAVLDRYRKSFDKDKQVGRFLKKIHINGKGTLQHVGIQKLSKYAQEIAEFLKLPEPEKYTGHCFRRTAATWAADSGCSLLQLKNLGGWTSDSAPQGYIGDSMVNKTAISTMVNSFEESSGGKVEMKSDTLTVEKSTKRPREECDENSSAVANSHNSNVTIAYHIDLSGANLTSSTFNFIMPNIPSKI